MKKLFYFWSIWNSEIDGRILQNFCPEGKENFINSFFYFSRTDNSIKNHFYSKLRKFIRKILKVLHKENVFEEHGIDSNYYTSDKIHKIIKKNNVPYNTLCKDIILDEILKHNKSCDEIPNIDSVNRKTGSRKHRKKVFFSLSKNSKL